MKYIYSFDTSAFIFLDREYSYDVFAPIWDKYLISLIDEKRIIVSDEVKEELKSRNDYLYKWVIDNCNGMFVKSDSSILGRVTDILKMHPNLVNPLKPSKNQADPFVIAVAIEASNICKEVCEDPTGAVVTYEKRTGNINGPKMPDICHACHLKVFKLIDIFKMEGWKLAG